MKGYNYKNKHYKTKLALLKQLLKDGVLTKKRTTVYTINRRINDHCVLVEGRYIDRQLNEILDRLEECDIIENLELTHWW